MDSNSPAPIAETVEEAEEALHSNPSTNVDPSLDEKATIAAGSLRALYGAAMPEIELANIKIDAGMAEIKANTPLAVKQAAARAKDAPRGVFKRPRR